MASPPARGASRDSYDPLRDTLDDDPFQQISLLSPSALSPPARTPSTPLTTAGPGNHNLLSTFDPYRPQLPSSSNIYTPSKNALLDDDSFISDADVEESNTVELLEMEEEDNQEEEKKPLEAVSYPSPYDPIQTSSGLLLTHRRTPARPAPEQAHDVASPGVKRALYKMETEHDAYRSTNGVPFYSNSRGMSFVQQSRRLLSLVRLWVIVSGFVLLMGTLVVVHHMRSEPDEERNATTAATVSEIRLVALEPDQYSMIQQHQPDQIVLLPLPVSQQTEGVPHQQHHRHLTAVSPRVDTASDTHHHRSLTELWSDFENWMSVHGKEYHSHEETQHRFSIWVENHHRTSAKNERHGPCKLTSQPVFGSNHLQDLTHEEFRDQYLTGYTGPKADEPGAKPLQVLGPHVSATRHAEVHRRIQEAWEAPARRASESDCSWYDVSCILRYVFQNYVYGMGGTMEPAYDADSYPEAVDWRDVGAVTSVRSQGNCGACWAITAVATVESAVFIATGELYNLAETEVIVCEEDCQMCSGGWPQNAFDYVMDNGGLPLSSDLYYDGEKLLLYTEALEGTSDELNESSVESYREQVCPAGSGSGDDSAGYTRYGGELEGYGYATNKCVCYTDGSGCDCDEQNEGLAVRNLATYGPAVVCLDASTWQDYSGGIITPESGCSAGFMDVNHCVQAVGYAFVSDSDNGDNEEGSGSGSGDSHDSGSQDSAREGYWIVKNQWSSYWGMNGYAYVSMGENTCGILNDMIQAYA